MNLKRIVFALFSPLIWIVKTLFGQLHWTKPKWLSFLSEKIRVAALNIRKRKDENPARFYKRTGVVLLGALVVGGVLFWWVTRPEPKKITISSTLPAPTILSEDKPPQVFPLRLHFSGSAAPIENIEKTVTKGISVLPELVGSWRWESDQELVFVVKDDWKVGEDYKISFDQSFFGKHVLLSDYEFAFRSPPFGATVEKTEFYENPLDALDKKVVTTVKFTHPVNKADFEKRITIKMRVLPVKNFDGDDVKLLHYKVLYNKLGTEAYIHSESIAIPEEDGEVLVIIEKGVRAEKGGPGSNSELKTKVRIPGLENYFKLRSIKGAIVKNDSFEPEHVVLIDSSVGLSKKDLEKNIEVFLLPVDKPRIGDKLGSRGYYWSDPKQVVPEVLALSTPVAIQWIESEREYNPLQSFRYEAEIGRFVFVRIKKGLLSFGGYPLKKDFSEIVRVDEFPPEVKVMHEGSILSVTGEKKLSIVARNLKTIRYSLYRLLPQTVNHFVTQTSGKFQNPNFNWNFGVDNISEVFTNSESLPEVSPGKAQYSSFDFGSYLSANPTNSQGLFLLKVSNWDPKEQVELYPSDQRLVLITDLGVLVKDAQDETHDLFVQSIHAGGPVADAAVEVIGKNGLSIFSGTTSEDGHVSIPVLKDFKQEKEAIAYVIKKEGDLSFLPFHREDRQLNFSRFDTGGLHTLSETESLQAYLFSDRGIYRPGEEIHLGMIVKKSDWSPLAAGTPLELIVNDPRGIEIRREVVRFEADGFNEYHLKTREASLTGSYQFVLRLVRKNKSPVFLGSATARVEEFLPDRLTIKSSFEPPPGIGWVSPEDLRVKVNLNNLYGTPAIGHKVRGSLKLNPSFPAFSQYREYTFFDPLRAKHSFDEVLGEQTTNENGEVEFLLDLNRFEKASYALSFVAEGFEKEGGRGVSTAMMTTVSPLSFLVAYKADGDLSYIRREAQRGIEFIAVDKALEKVSTEGLSYEIVEIRYVSALTKQANGTVSYQSVKKETIKEKHPLLIPKEGFKFILPSAEPGTFALVVRDKSETELNRVQYSIIGDGNTSRSLERNAELQIKLNKNDFLPGEEIELEIQAPYVGSGLITIERDKVYNFKWFTTSTTTTTQRIQVPESLDGNGYVNVSFIRALDSKEIYMSPLSYGVSPFTVNKKRHMHPITMKVPELIVPGEALQISYQTETPSKVVIVAVDEGILQVARFKTPDPLAHYYRKRALEVETSQILDLILPEFSIIRELSSTGGDEEGALAKHLNPFKRKGQKPVAFWSGILPGSAEEKTVSYVVPDYFNGNIRVHALSVTADAIGVSEQKTTVRGPFVISPNAPYFVSPGDQFEVTATVANNIENSGKDAKVKVWLETSPSLIVKEISEKTETIPEGRDASFRFLLSAEPRLGPANLIFHASLGEKSVTYTTDLSVRPASSFLTTVSSGVFHSGLITKGSKELDTQRKMYSELALREASVSNSPLGFARGLIQYLRKFPHGCTEQVVSQAFPSVIFGEQEEFSLDRESVSTSLERAYLVLQGRQNGEGAFSYWSGGADVSDYQSIYGMHFLLEGKARGFHPPESLIERGVSYLEQVSQKSPESLGTYRERAYAIYILTRNGKVTTNYLSSLRERLEKFQVKDWKKDITALYMASTYRLLKLDAQASALLRELDFNAPITPDYALFFDKLSYQGMYLYLVSLHFPEELSQFEGEKLLSMTEQIVNGNFNTLSSALVLLGLDAYTKAVSLSPPSTLSIAEVDEKGSETVLSLPKSQFPFVLFSENAAKIRFEGDSTRPLFYQLTEAGFDRELPQVVSTKRIEVVREFRNSLGEVVSEATLGDTLNVQIGLRALGDEYLQNIAVIDLLPGGFEADVSSVREGGGHKTDHWYPDSLDIREDRTLLYGGIGNKVKRFTYLVKATARGEFHVPPVVSESMYDRGVYSSSLGGKFKVR